MFSLVLSKLIGAVILFFITFTITLLPTKLRHVEKLTLKSISCFCGGLFLGLCFLHLIPESINAFENSPSLNKLQQGYPIAEFIICVGMMVVMATERIVEVFESRPKKKKCDNSDDCCKETCRKKDEPPVPPSDDVTTKSKNVKKNISNKEQDNESISSQETLVEDSTQRRKRNIRTFCLVIALMVHSLFEGLTVGLQTRVLGIVALIALLALHKGLIGFSLGINIICSKQSIGFHIKHAFLFSIASPFGIVVGLIILSSNISRVNKEAVTILTSLSTGSFLFITFFEILAKDLRGSTVRDLVNFGLTVLGYAIFASVSIVHGI